MIYIDLAENRITKLHPLGKRGVQKDSIYALNYIELRKLVEMEYVFYADFELYTEILNYITSKVWSGGNYYTEEELLSVYSIFETRIQDALDDYLDGVDMSYLGEEYSEVDIMEAIDLKIEHLLSGFVGGLRYLLQGGYRIKFHQLNSNDIYVVDVEDKGDKGNLDVSSRAYMYFFGNKIPKDFGMETVLLGRKVKIGNILKLR